MNTRTIGLILGPIVFFAVLAAPTPVGLSTGAQAVAAITLLMAIWWMTEAIPIAATSLLPIVLYPALEIATANATTSSYGHYLVFLMLGGFIIAQAIERWGLHRRIALITVGAIGGSASRMVLGFMLATAMLSMWISNAATTVMMVPIAVAVVAELQRDKGSYHPLFGTALLLSIAYAASIGGTSTLIGTPPNVTLAGQLETLHNTTIDFLDWMLFATPIAAVMLVVVWLLFTKVLFRKGMQVPVDSSIVKRKLAELGKTTTAEWRVLIIFGCTALAWVLRGSIDFGVHKSADSAIAITGALLMFVVAAGRSQPGAKKAERLLDWETANKLPWSTLLLFGGGFALAAGFKSTGLSNWLGAELAVVQGMDTIWVVLAIVLVVIFLTEFTSNTATATIFIPIMSGMAVDDPVLLMIAATVAASYAFMLPVATPPNAIVFGSGHIRISQMVRAGLWLNIISTIILTAAITYWLPLAL